MSEEIKFCENCGMDMSIRNPSGYCDHLYISYFGKMEEKNVGHKQCSTFEEFVTTYLPNSALIIRVVPKEKKREIENRLEKILEDYIL